MPTIDRIRENRRTVRLRLTLTYGALFLLCGTALLAITYWLVAQNMPAVNIRGTSTMANAQPALAGPTPGPATDSEQSTTLLRTLHQAQLRQLLVQSGTALGIMSTISIGLGYIVAGRLLSPLRTITRKAREISATNLHERLALTGPQDELKDLGDTIDDLLTRLDASFHAQRQFVANASHELRTPLARQRTLVQVALSDPEATVESLRTAHERSLAVNRHQERLIQSLLTLARSTSGPERHEPVDLARLTERVLADSSSEAGQRGIRLDPALRPAPTAGDPNLLERLVANLVDNAVRHNVSGGWIAITTDTTAGRAAVTITNTGATVSESEVGRLFQPFQRIGANRTSRDGGLGLGLSIVLAIATAHHATVRAHPRTDGGLEVTVIFPSAPDVLRQVKMS
jgi:signal transduction histidine kinase